MNETPVTPEENLERLRRFMCLGSERSIYQANSQNSTFSRYNVSCLESLLNDENADFGMTVLDAISDVSINNKACRQAPTLFAFAFCVVHGRQSVKNRAYRMLSDICRIPTHLFEFEKFCKELNRHKINPSSGWGRSHKVAINKWYNAFAENPQRLAYLVTKYKKRRSWTHKDVIRLAHVKPANERIRTIIKYLTKKDMAEVITLHESLDKDHKEVKTIFKAVTEAKHCQSHEDIKRLIANHEIVREHIPNRFLSDKEIWQTLLRTMPLTAMIRNLGKMTKLKVFDDQMASFFVHLVKEKMQPESLVTSRIHPFRVLFALKQYTMGEGNFDHSNWLPNQDIIKILEEAFYELIQFQKVTGMRYLLAVNVSGNMKEKLIGSPMTASEAASAMVLQIVKREPSVQTLLFVNDLAESKISTINPQDNLNSIKDKLENFPHMVRQNVYHWAQSTEKFDAIIVFTDTLLGEGDSRVAEPFDHYTHLVAAPNHKRVIVAMTSKPKEAFQPSDHQTLHVIGFDQSTPAIISGFLQDFEEGFTEMDGVTVYS